MLGCLPSDGGTHAFEGAVPRILHMKPTASGASAGLPGDLPIHEMPGYLVRRLHQVAVRLSAEEIVGLKLTPAQFANLVPTVQWPSIDRVRLLGHAAHPATQSMRQGACTALEDAVTLGEALRLSDNDVVRAFDPHQRSRSDRTSRIVFGSREMGRIYHAKGIERLDRDDLWHGRTPERLSDALEWLCSWKVDHCLAD